MSGRRLTRDRLQQFLRALVSLPRAPDRVQHRGLLGARARLPRPPVQSDPGDRLPFDDGEFDLAVSFAVLEHVGSTAQQRRFIGELARVAPAFIAYTPYRYFPVEMHTLLPLLHWLPVLVAPPLVAAPRPRVLGRGGEPQPPGPARSSRPAAGVRIRRRPAPVDRRMALEHRAHLAGRGAGRPRRRRSADRAAPAGGGPTVAAAVAMTLHPAR